MSTVLVAAPRREKSRRRVTATLGADLEDVEQLRQLFGLASSGGAMGKEDFAQLCQSLLHIDLSYRELERIFEIMVFAEGEQLMTEDKFIRTIRNRFFLRGIRRVVQLPSASANLPEGFNLDEDTATNHSGEKGQFVGPYADIRATRDHSFHGCYSAERQRWQDSVIDTVVQRTTEQARPRLVFTCGAMGVGKGYALSWMSNKGIFPLEDIVHIDPDHFKAVMPEWPAYVAHGRLLKDPSLPGTQCHRESCYMQEIALEESLRRLQHIWVDGSLRNAEWFVKVFSDIRERYPAYQIAIFKITAPETAIRARVEKRAQQTGRSVPEETLKESIEAVERSVLTLMPHADFLASIDNASTPTLQYFSAIDRSGSWSRITARFAHTLPGVEAFPEALSPFFLTRLETCPQLRLFHSLQYRVDGATQCQYGELMVRDLAIQVKLSPAIRVTLDPETRRIARIHEEAVSVAFLHPLDTEDLDTSHLTHAESQAVKVGAFGNFCLNDELVALNAVSSSATERQPAMLEFADSIAVSREQAQALHESRWSPVPLEHIKAAGVERFAFLSPLEKLAGRRVSSSSGFVFEMPGKDYAFFPIIASYE